MNEFIEKLIGRLEEGREKSFSEYTEALELYREEFWRGRMGGFTNAIEIVNQLAEEYNSGWIPSDEPPKTEDYILLSFENFPVPLVGRYEEDEEGGAFYVGDDTESCVSSGIIVNAWQPLPEPFKPIAE